MKKTNMFLSLLLALVMLLSLLPAAAQAAGSYTVSLSASAGSVTAGSTFTVAVKVTSTDAADTVATLQTGIAYDQTKVAYVSAAAPDGLTAEATFSSGAGTLAVHGAAQTVGAGGVTMATLTFQALADVTGDAAFTVGSPMVGVSDGVPDTNAAAGGGATVTIEDGRTKLPTPVFNSVSSDITGINIAQPSKYSTEYSAWLDSQTTKLNDMNEHGIPVPDNFWEFYYLCEFRISADGETWSAWQSSCVFSGLTPDTYYYFQCRYAPNSNSDDAAGYTVSDPWTPVRVKTFSNITPPVITVTSSTPGVAPGGTVTLALSMANSPAYTQGSVRVACDKNQMTLASAAFGVGQSSGTPNFSYNSTGKYYTVSYYNRNDQSQVVCRQTNGELLRLTFTVSESAGANKVTAAVSNFSLSGVQEEGAGGSLSLSGTLGNPTVEVSVLEGVTVTFNAPYLAVAKVDGIAKASVVAAQGVDFSFTVSPALDAAEITSVTAGGETLTPENGVYKLPSLMEDVTVTITADWKTQTPDLTIMTKGDLLAFASAVNGGNDYSGKVVRLGADIDLTGETSWVPIGSSAAKAFKGTFEGNGHSVAFDTVVTDVTGGLNVGLFRYAQGAVIRGVTVSGSISVTCNASNPFGAVVTYAYGCVVADCVNRAELLTTAAGAAGIAYICETNSSYPGLDESVCGVYGCMNYGDITARYSVYYPDSPSSYYTAGISTRATKIQQCGNTGDVFGGATSTGAYLIGYGIDLVADCYNSGNLTTNTCGYVESGAAAASGGILRNCYNTGSITTLHKGDKGYFANGVYAFKGNPYVNCYNTGTVSAPNRDSACAWYVADYFDSRIANPQATNPTSWINSYKASEASGITASAMGSAYKADVNNINGGYPLLWWQPDTVSDEEFTITFSVTPADASVTVYTDATKTGAIAPESDGTYSLKAGVYPYTVSQSGYLTQEGSFTVKKAMLVSVTLHESAVVTFNVSPVNAVFTLAISSGNAVTPDSSSNGSYVYTLQVGETYNYTAVLNGYNTVERGYAVLSGGGTVAVTLIPSGYDPNAPEDKYIYGSGNSGKTSTISTGGTYYVGDGATGVITVSTPNAVTLVGQGISTAAAYEHLFIDYTCAGANLILQDLYISDDLSGSMDLNMIDFTGAGNHLYWRGTCCLDWDGNAVGYAGVHVGPGTELTLGGVTAGDTLYFYKREQGAGIGGNGGASGGEGQAAEYNGKITITGGNLFIKGSKQGAVIGSGAAASGTGGTPGDIIIQDGVINGISVARGALIGGSAGSSGGATGSNVYLYGGTLNFNVDYSGAAIGGGGYAEGNDSDGGTLHYYGGSIRTFIDYNAIDPAGDGNDAGHTSDSLWKNFGVTDYGVNDAAITADKVNANEEPLYLCVFDTTKLSDSTSSFTVKDGDSTVYSGGLHQYCYVNENLFKENQIAINYTVDNWVPLTDPNLYLYLTGEDHTLTVNGETFDVAWDEETSTFTVTASGGETPGLQGDINSDGIVDMADLSLLLSAYGTADTAGDINSDSIVDMADLSLLLSAYGHAVA